MMERNHPEFDTHEQPDHRLAMIALVDVRHPTVPNLYQRCFEYSEPWQWSPETERVQTGQWFFAPEPRLLPNPAAKPAPAIVKPSSP
jgi:hypothetical protein